MRVKKRILLRSLRIAVTIICFCVLLGGFFLFLKSDFWTIKKAECENLTLPCPNRILFYVKNATIGKNIIFFKTESLVKKVLSENLSVKEARIRKNLPDKITVEIKNREPIAAIGVQLTLGTEKSASESARQEFTISEEVLEIDEQGIVLAKAKKTDLPIILIDKPLNIEVGQKIMEDKLLKITNILYKMKLYLLEPKIVQPFSSKIAKIWLKDNLLVQMSLEKDFKSQLDSLQLILGRAKIEGKKASRLDLQFDKPVIIYE